MAKPATVNIEVVRGDSFDIYIGISRNGTRTNLTGSTVSGMVRATLETAGAAASFTCVLANQTTDPGGVVCSLSKTDTTAFDFTKGVYDIQVDFSGGVDRTTVIAGTVNVTKDVTHA